MADRDPRGQRQPLSHLPSNKKAASQVAAHAVNQASLAGSPRLPHELWSHIIALACSLPSLPADGCSPALDVATARSLALTSRHFHAQANPLLWSVIRITRPSALLDLCQAVDARHDLASHIYSLHVGAEEEARSVESPDWRSEAMVPPEGVWPPPITMVVASLSRAGVRCLLAPRWCEAEKEWALDALYDNDCTAIAVSRALLSIQHALDVDLTGRDARRPRSIPRLYEAQAALDMYLDEIQARQHARKPSMRLSSIDEVDGPSKGCFQHMECPDFPTLVLVGRPLSAHHLPPACDQPVLCLTRQHLHHHIDRPGSSHDRFDHPILFARTIYTPEYLSAPLKESTRWQPNNYRPVETRNSEEMRKQLVERQKWVRDAAHLQMVTPTVLGLRLRSLLTHTSSLQSLSLSSHFAHGFYMEGVAPLKCLRSLVLGPPPRLSSWWQVALSLRAAEEITSLHLCGFLPPGQDAPGLALLHRLKELRWTLSDQLTDREVLYVGIFLDALIGRTGAAADQAAAQAMNSVRPDSHKEGADAIKGLAKLRDRMVKRAGEQYLTESEEEAGLTLSPQPLIEVRLQPEALAALLDRAASAEERQAWATGRPVCGQARKLLLAEIPAVRSMTSHGTLQHPLYEESRKWWEEHRAPAKVGMAARAEGQARGQSSGQLCVCC